MCLTTSSVFLPRSLGLCVQDRITAAGVLEHPWFLRDSMEAVSGNDLRSSLKVLGTYRDGGLTDEAPAEASAVPADSGAPAETEAPA